MTLLRSALRFLEPLNYKYFASTRLTASVITHKFVAHPKTNSFLYLIPNSVRVCG